MNVFVKKNKNKIELEAFIQTIRIYDKDIVMEFWY